MPLRVLLVDDNTAMAEGLRMLLDIIGYEVQTTPDGPAALAAAHPFKAQAGLLDIGLAWYGQLLISQELASSARRHALTFNRPDRFWRHGDARKSQAGRL
ncbi:MAG: hypothetical protein M3329_05840 [Pseudomonadota bacterium]|nr:hypothetical protein [Pseudomonadota bacterium]